MNMTLSPSNYLKFTHVWWLLRITYGLLFIVAGADKFTKYVAEWEKYISPLILKHIPLTSFQIIVIVAIFEILLGVLILGRTRQGAYIAAGWLIVIAVNLATMMLLDIAVRDIVMAIAAFSLGQLTDVKEQLSQ